MNLKKMAFSGAMAALSLLPIRADEGMWLLPLLKQQNMDQLREAGLGIEIEDIYNPDGISLKDAIVIFGNGCTGEIISSEGLLLTNHHCGYGAIQQHSTVNNDYLANGFWAMNRSEEIATPGLTVQFIDKIEDVTDFVIQELANDSNKGEMDFLSPKYLQKVMEKMLGEAYDAENKSLSIEIKPFYGGNKYYMFTKKIYSDIRMVGAPPSSIGKFGADTDNWMWPRHTGDFALFRVYADKEGNPVEYSPENTPLRPKKWLNINLGGIKENDFAMVMGFPGTTNRYYTSDEVRSRRDIGNETRIHIREIRQNVLLEEMLADPKVRIQYASKYARSSNYYKNSIGMNTAVNKLGVIERKEREEELFKQWANSSNKPQFAEALNRINALTTQLDSLQKQHIYLTEALITAIEFSRVPTETEGLIKAIQHKKQTDITHHINLLEESYHFFANKDYNASVDHKVAKAIFKIYLKDVPVKDQASVFNLIRTRYKGNYQAYLQECFTKSIFANQANFNRFKAKPTVAALESDPMIVFAKSVREKQQELSEKTKPLTTQLAKEIKTYIAGLLNKNEGEPAYPDANFTMRLSYGNVLSYEPKDGSTFHYYTTLKGVMEKEDPTNWEFVVPDRLKQLWNDKDFGPYALPNGEMPVCFISNNDITGGNSGSPVMNANGELIGCAFDGNWEAMSGDIVFEPALQRTINVDIRYILFIIDKFAGAKHLVDEMTIVNN